MNNDERQSDFELQWGHVLSDMVTPRIAWTLACIHSLQWGHVLSDMVTWLASVLS